MRNKKYRIRVKMIHEICFETYETCKDRAETEIELFIKKCIEEQMDLRKIFTKNPTFKYKTELIKRK